MIYRVKDKSLKAYILIQLRYFLGTFLFIISLLVALILLSCLVNKELSLSPTHYLIGVFILVAILYRLGNFAWENYKNSNSDYVELTESFISSNYMGNSDTIKLSSIDEIIVYNLLGNQLIVICFDGETHEMYIGGYDGDLICDLLNQIGNRMRKASFFQNLKYLVYSE